MGRHSQSGAFVPRGECLDQGRPKVCCAHICHHLFGPEWRRVLGPVCCGHSVAEHLSSAGFVPREVTFVGGPTRSIQKVAFPP